VHKSLFLKNAIVMTMDRDRRELHGADNPIVDGKIHPVGVEPLRLPTRSLMVALLFEMESLQQSICKDCLRVTINCRKIF